MGEFRDSSTGWKILIAAGICLMLSFGLCGMGEKTVGAGFICLGLFFLLLVIGIIAIIIECIVK